MRLLHALFVLAILSLIPAPSFAQNAQPMTLKEAEQIAIQNHPQIQAATNLAAAARAQVKEVRSVYYPQAYGSATGAVAENDSRIAAGGLNNSIVYDRYANGVTVNQLISDFGRTHELARSSNLHAQAQQENVTTHTCGRALASGSGLFRGAEGEGSAPSCAGNREESATGGRSSERAREEPIEIDAGRELCKRESGASAASARSSAE
jgi:hypothetical protein